MAYIFGQPIDEYIEDEVRRAEGEMTYRDYLFLNDSITSEIEIKIYDKEEELRKHKHIQSILPNAEQFDFNQNPPKTYQKIIKKLSYDIYILKEELQRMINPVMIKSALY